MQDNSVIFSKFGDAIEQARPYWVKYRPNQAEDVYSSAKEKLSRESLHIQLYGAYNAGKSTLVNVLLGYEAASIGEIPTTDQIDLYDWNGIKLVDSPGTNAPIEHEEVTTDALKKNDLIVFLVRQGEQDVRDVYSRIVENLTAGKKVFIVLNYENALDSSQQDPWSLIPYIEDRITQVANESGAQLAEKEVRSGSIEIIPVNLSSAVRGRLEGKDLLLEHSGYYVLRSRLSEWIKEYDTEHQRVAGIQSFLHEHYLGPLLEEVGSKTNESEVKEQQQAVNHLLRVRDNTLKKAENHARGITQTLKEGLSASIEEADGQESAERIINSHISAAADDFQSWLSSELQEDIVVRLDRIAKNASDFEGDDYAQSEKKGAEDYLYHGLQTVISDPRVVDTQLAGAVAKLAENLPKWFAKIPEGGRLVTVLGNASHLLQRAGPIAATIAGIGAAVLDNKKQDEANRLERERAQKKRQLVESVGNDFFQAAREHAEAVLNPAFEESIQAARQDLENLDSELKDREKDYISIMEIARNVNALRVA